MLRILIIIALYLFSSHSMAELYKNTDDEGVTTYSDQPSEGAVEIQPPEGNEIKLPKYVPRKRNSIEEDDYYQYISITSPDQDAVIRDNQGNLTITIDLDPKLRIVKGDGITLLMDGSPVQDKSIATSYPLTNIDRGAHVFIAKIVDTDGRTIIESEPVTIHMKRFSQLH